MNKDFEKEMKRACYHSTNCDLLFGDDCDCKIKEIIDMVSRLEAKIREDERGKIATNISNLANDMESNDLRWLADNFEKALKLKNILSKP